MNNNQLLNKSNKSILKTDNLDKNNKENNNDDNKKDSYLKCNKCGFIYISAAENKTNKCPLCKSEDKTDIDVDNKDSENKSENKDEQNQIEELDKLENNLNTLNKQLDDIKYNLSYKSAFKDLNQHFEDSIVGLISLVLTTDFIDKSFKAMQQQVTDISKKNEYVDLKKNIDKILDYLDNINESLILRRGVFMNKNRKQKRNKKRNSLIYQQIPLWAAMDSGDYSKLSSDRNIQNAVDNGSIDASDVPLLA